MLFLVSSLLLLLAGVYCDDVLVANERPFKLSLTVSAKLNAIEVSWFNLKTPNNGYILLTNNEPTLPFKKYQSNAFDSDPSRIHANTVNGSGGDSVNESKFYENTESIQFTYGDDDKTALFWTKPSEDNGWIRTSVIFDRNLLNEVHYNTKCYGYWAIYIDEQLKPIEKICMRTYATYMNDNRQDIETFRIRDLFLLGSHDSGSYRTNFNATTNETIVTKYALTQNDDILTQLMHGVRYLDIRVAYYRALEPQFWVNHGISRQQPLNRIIGQVKDFVEQTNEVVIFDLQEFPIGFSKSLDVHRKLVRYLEDEFKDLYVDASLTWNVKLEQIWQSKRNIIISYDNTAMVQEFPHILFQNVHHRWGNVQSLADLRRFLAPNAPSFPRFTFRPFSDQAEITPTTWEVITDRYGGLRQLADRTNSIVSKWYMDEWGMSANIVSVDFYRGTNLMETIIHYNKKKNQLRQMRQRRSLIDMLNV